jgi:hypothetical protein
MMVKSTAKIEKYDGNNIYFVGREKPLYIEATDIKAAMTNFPAGMVVTYATGTGATKGTLKGMMLPTPAEQKSYEDCQKAGAGQSTTENFQPAGQRPRDPAAEQKSAKDLLQQNLDAKKAETASGVPVRTVPACFKPALCSKGCDGTKDPCPFRPKIKPKEDAPKQAAGSSGPVNSANPPKVAGSAPQGNPPPASTHSVNGDAIQEPQVTTPQGMRVTIAATVNLLNYENIKVEIEGDDAETCKSVLIGTLNSLAVNPAHSQTRDLIRGYMARVLNVKEDK